MPSVADAYHGRHWHPNHICIKCGISFIHEAADETTGQLYLSLVVKEEIFEDPLVKALSFVVQAVFMPYLDMEFLPLECANNQAHLFLLRKFSCPSRVLPV